MKKKLIGLSTLVCIGLVGCASLAFDAGEFDRLVSMKIESDRAVMQCGTANAYKSINSLAEMAAHQYVYAQYRSNRQQIDKASTEVSSMIAELNDKYKNGGQPSATYCQVKLADISSGLQTMLKTMGGM